MTRITAAATDRRAEAGEPRQALQQLTGLNLDRSDATAAAGLCGEIEERYGPEMLSEMLQDHSKLPSLGELRDVGGWIARTQLD